MVGARRRIGVQKMTATTRAAWLLFAPPFMVTALHVILTTLAERWPSAQPLVAARVGGDGVAADSDAAVHALIWQASWPVLLALGVAVGGALLARVLLRRVGWARLKPGAVVLWMALWVALAAGLLLRHVNGALLTPLPAASARVLEARHQPSSERGPGGALALLQLQGDDTPRRVLLEGADARALPRGPVLTLQRARGRLWGDYVTGSDAPAAPRANADAAPAQVR